MLPVIAAALPFANLSLTDQIPQFGIWAYILVFVVITLASTIIGGPIPDNTFLVLTGAVALNNGLSVEWLFVAAVAGGFAGYEINYWSGRLIGLAVCRDTCPGLFRDRNVRNALDLLDRFGPAALIISRFMPVLNLPSFIAGVSAMEYRRYAGFNLISSAVWSGTLLLSGYFIGSLSPVSTYLEDLMDLFVILLMIIILFVLGTFVRDYLRHALQNEEKSGE